MKSISVIVPTADQPKLLATALHSIARQSVRDQIEEVLVSENLKNRDSEAVCRKFPQLPIRYTLQDPPLSLVQNFDFLFREARAEVVALLCDDDWWGPGHLQGALTALEDHKTAVARFSACLHVASDSAWTGLMSHCPVLWLAAGRPSCDTVWVLNGSQVLAAASILTPFHWSSLVARRSALRELAPTWKHMHSHQSDRILQASLATLGTIIYEPLVDVFVRSHREATTWKLSHAERANAFRTGTEMIWELCGRLQIDLASVWRANLKGVDQTIVEEAGQYFRMALDDSKLKAHGLEMLIPPGPVVRLLRRATRIAKNRWAMYKPLALRSLGLARRQPSNGAL